MPNPKNYYRPQTMEEAIERAVQPGSIALVGGAFTLGGMLLPYETVVDLQDLAELRRIELSGHGLIIGGGSSLQAVVESSLTPELLRNSLLRSLPVNIRSGASVLESLTAKSPPREWVAGLIALGTVLEHAGKLHPAEAQSLWEQPVDEFIEFLHLHRHSYQGIIVRIRIPAQAAHMATAAAHVARTPKDDPIVNAAVTVTLNPNKHVRQAAAAIGGAAAAPVIMLPLQTMTGSLLDDASIESAAQFVMGTVQPVSDYRGGIEYRREMAGVCVRRALEECREKLV